MYSYISSKYLIPTETRESVGSLGNELQMAIPMMATMEIKPWSSGRAAGALRH